MKTVNNIPLRKKTAIIVIAIILIWSFGIATASAINTIGDGALISDSFNTEMIKEQSFSKNLKYPAVVIPANAVDKETVIYKFDFNSELRTVEIEIDMNNYAAATNTDKNVLASSNNIKKEDWISGYYLTLMTDPVNYDSYNGVISELTRIKDEEELDSDGYADLMVKFVQSIPYYSEGLDPKYPVETLYEMKGDCDDKSILLSALFTIEGYGSSMMYFDSENHVSVGLLGSSHTFRDMGYLYVETTKTALIGIVPNGAGGNFVVSSNPVIIPVSKGLTEYTSSDENFLIHDDIIITKDKIDNWESNDNKELNILISRYNYSIANLSNRADLYEWIISH